MSDKPTIEYKNEKPRVRFCHECSRKLRGNYHAIVKYPDIDHEFIMHKDCAKKVLNER